MPIVRQNTTVEMDTGRSQHTEKSGEFFAIGGIAILALLGVLILSFITRWGAGVSNDSVVYIRAARFLAEGFGFSTISDSGRIIPLTHFPPLFPALLSTGGFFNIDPLVGAKFLNHFLFFASVLLVGLLN